MGPQHGLLAILNAAAHEPGRRALEAVSLTTDRIESTLIGYGRENEDDAGVTTNPAWHKVFGRAEGLGFANGSDLASANFVIAMLWDDHLWRYLHAEFPRERVIDALAYENVVLPASEPPAFDQREFTQKVDVPLEYLDRVRAELVRRHREEGGPSIGFNVVDDTMGFVISEDGIDLQAVVDELIAAHSEVTTD